MPTVVVALVVIATVTAVVTAALAARATGALAALRAEATALGQLRAAQELLVADLDRTRRDLDRPTDVWPSGQGR